MHHNIKKIWLDCDPGHDDMMAIILAANSEEIQLIGISTSAGNSVIENTTQNALDILEEIGKSFVTVVRGAEKPLCREIKTASEIHGESGLEGAKLIHSSRCAIIDQPFLYIYKALKKAGKVSFVVTGAMTNLAILLKGFPDIKDCISEVTIMGGAIGLGNMSPAAQFNIFVDPEAAAIVFAQGLALTMIPLELTHTVLITEDIFAQLGQMKSSFSQKLIPLFRYFQVAYKQTQDFEYPVAHDPCTIYYLLHPEDFTGRQANVQIQLSGTSRGRTNVHFKAQNNNAFVCERINVKRFWNKMLHCIRIIK